MSEFEDLGVGNAPLPVQFDDVWSNSHAIAPERTLALAVLEQAAHELRKNRFATRRRQQRFYIETYHWVGSDDRSWPFSFASLCDMLGFEPEALRERLLALDYGLPGNDDIAA